MKGFTDRVTVVTGAASGIGRALARELARRGAHLALADLDEAGLADTAGAAVERNQRRLLVGPDAKFVDLLSRLPPALYQRVLVAGARLWR